MPKNKVFAWKCMPSKIPIWDTAVLWLMMDKIAPRPWIVGAVWTVWAILAIASTVAHFTQEYVDVLNIGPDPKGKQ